MSYGVLGDDLATVPTIMGRQIDHAETCRQPKVPVYSTTEWERVRCCAYNKIKSKLKGRLD